jgi:hypothetical protein
MMNFTSGFGARRNAEVLGLMVSLA